MKYRFKQAMVMVLILFGTALSGMAQASGASQDGTSQASHQAQDGSPQSVKSQDAGVRPWYIGVQGGTSLGQCTFRSITEHEIHPGVQGGLFGGYRFGRLVSLEAAVQYGAQSQRALDCCTYWLSEDGVRYLSPVVDQTGWYYHDLDTRTQWGKLALQVNADLLSLVTRPTCRWSLNVGPQIGAVTTKTRLVAPDKEITYDRQWHLGLGGQASLGYRITQGIGASLYAGITCMTGERFDNIPEHAHKSNLFYDAGLKVTFSFGGPRKAKEAEDASADEAARLAAEQAAREEAARAEREKAEQAAREEAERLEREAREQAERERLEREARERAEREAAEKEAAFSTPIPTVYFANESSTIGSEHQASLEMALAILEKYPDFNLEIHAYCSKSGPKRYNNMLSRKRMEAIQNWFIEHGISKDRMGASYYHGIDYKAPSADKARRAELWFVK